MMIIGAINAFNMLDGMDGVAGAAALVALLGLAFVSADDGLASVSLVIAGSVCGFMMFNVPTHLNRPVRCFMGDSGSTLLGFCVAWLCILVSQGPAREVAPATILWFVALPLFELIWSTVRRVVRGVSPFRPDKNHFHHLLLKAGFGVRAAFGILAALAMLLACFGLVAESIGLSHTQSFLLLAVAGVIVSRLMYHADVLWLLVPKQLRRMPGN
jgi:UDP-GlcNAc:undecaprenyl-phosphate GlcNAc-1-phosphate transferase